MYALLLIMHGLTMQECLERFVNCMTFSLAFSFLRLFIIQTNRIF